MRVLEFVLGTLLLLGPGKVLAFAAQPVPFQFTAGQSLNLQQPVEQQTQGGATQPDPALWVVNNTGFPWDVDDSHLATDTGYIDPGVSLSYTEYIVGDWMQHLAFFRATADSRTANFSLTLRVDDSIGTNILITSRPPQLIGVLHGSAVSSQLAFFAPWYWQSSPKLVPIPNSGIGGIGRIFSVTYTITNQGSKRLNVSVDHNIWDGQLGFYRGQACPEGDPVVPWDLNRCTALGADPSACWCQAAAVTFN